MPEGWVALEHHLRDWHDVDDAVLEGCDSEDLRRMHLSLHRRAAKRGKQLRRSHWHD